MSSSHPPLPTLRPSVLVVDDDPLSREMLVLMLESIGAPVRSVEDGQAAVDAISAGAENTWPIVFTDVQMPRLDGLGLLAWLNRHSPDTATVIMTGNQERALVSASLRGGAVEFLDKPFDLASVLRTLDAAADTHRKRAARTAAHRRLRDVADINARLTRPAAKALARHPAGLSLSTRFYPISEAGGDFVKATPLDDDRLLLALGDVSGHGLKEGFVSAYFQGIIEGMARGTASADAIAENFNRFLCEDWNDPDDFTVGTSLSACLLEIDLGTRNVQVLNFGCPAPRLADASGRVEPLAPGGSALGWFPSPAPTRAQTTIADHGQIWLWSDGLEDHAERLGVPALALAHRVLAEPPQSLHSTVLAEAADDIVVCHFRWGLAHDGTDRLWLPVHQETLPGDSASKIDHLHAAWQRFVSVALGETGTSLAHDLPLCLREAVLNALDHGCRHDPARRVHISVSLDPAARHVLAHVTDDGDGFDPQQPPPGRDPEHISLGLQLIRSLTQDCGHQDSGRTLFMLFPLPPANKLA